MMKQIVLYIAISIVVSLGVGYSTGHYVASNKAEKDIAVIRAILEEERAEKTKKKQEAENRMAEYLKEGEEIRKRRNSVPSKGY